MFKDLEKDGDISKDDSKKAQDNMQKVHDVYIAEIGTLSDEKEKEIMDE